jgi:hypothetical protein
MYIRTPPVLSGKRKRNKTLPSETNDAKHNKKIFMMTKKLVIKEEKTY